MFIAIIHNLFRRNTHYYIYNSHNLSIIDIIHYINDIMNDFQLINILLLSIIIYLIISIFELIIKACKKTDDSEIKILLEKLNEKLDYKNARGFSK